jgi:hypothetical protein
VIVSQPEAAIADLEIAMPSEYGSSSDVAGSMSNSKLIISLAGI